MKRKLPASEIVAKMWESGEYTQKQIGQQYGVSNVAVHDCLKRYYNLKSKPIIKYGHELLLKFLKNNPNASYKEMMKAVGVGETTIGKYLDVLESEGRIKRVKYIILSENWLKSQMEEF